MTLVTEVTVICYLPFSQDSQVSTVRYANLCLQGKVSIPGQQVFCMHKKVEAKSTVATLQTEAICLMVSVKTHKGIYIMKDKLISKRFPKPCKSDIGQTDTEIYFFNVLTFNVLLKKKKN